jgi:hypothetical protein
VPAGFVAIRTTRGSILCLLMFIDWTVWLPWEMILLPWRSSP